MSPYGTLLPRADAAACPQLAKADFASSSRRVREGQRIAALDAEVDALQRQALGLGAEPTADVPALGGFTRSGNRCSPRARGVIYRPARSGGRTGVGRSWLSALVCAVGVAFTHPPPGRRMVSYRRFDAVVRLALCAFRTGFWVMGGLCTAAFPHHLATASCACGVRDSAPTLSAGPIPKAFLAERAIERVSAAEFSDRPLVAAADPGRRAVLVIWRVLSRPTRIARDVRRFFGRVFVRPSFRLGRVSCAAVRTVRSRMFGCSFVR
jgi:hypothetical protein